MELKENTLALKSGDILEIEKRWAKYKLDTWDKQDIEWLISRVKELGTENQELESLFDLQHSRTKEADKLWQESTGKKNVLPDLGELIGWLVDDNQRLREAIERHQRSMHMVIPQDKELYSVLEQKCTCHMSHGECPVHGSVWDR